MRRKNSSKIILDSQKAREYSPLCSKSPSRKGYAMNVKQKYVHIITVQDDELFDEARDMMGERGYWNVVEFLSQWHQCQDFRPEDVLDEVEHNRLERRYVHQLDLARTGYEDMYLLIEHPLYMSLYWIIDSFEDCQ